MITPDYVQRMARYNRWQNENIYVSAERLPGSERKRERGAFFGSIHGTLAHLLWGDMTWMRRFDPSFPTAPTRPGNAEFVGLWSEWDDLKHRRSEFDEAIIAWSHRVEQVWLNSDVTWTSTDGSRTATMARWILTAHLFNHQTHHRGQVHAMLTQSGIKPGDTDLILMGEME